MRPAHASAHGGHAGTALLLAAVLLLGLYLLAARGARRRGHAVSALRVASFFAGMALVVGASTPPLATLAHADLRAHMVQHLFLGMLGPIGLVLGAPLTLTLRALPAPAARRVVAVLRGPPVHWLAHPFLALTLNIGGMALLYATPLYAAMATRPALHAAVHFHFLAAGCLFSWSIAGTDPGPRRPSHAARLAVLFVAIAAHATLAKAMYAYAWPSGTVHEARELEEAAMIMYYGGDLSELLLAAALFATWPRFRAPARAKRLARGSS